MSWYQLLAIRQEGRQIRQTQAATAPTSCPYCGTIILRDRQNRLRCQFDGWVWDGVRNPLVDNSIDGLVPVQAGNVGGVLS